MMQFAYKLKVWDYEERNLLLLSIGLWTRIVSPVMECPCALPKGEVEYGGDVDVEVYGVPAS